VDSGCQGERADGGYGTFDELNAIIGSFRTTCREYRTNVRRRVRGVWESCGESRMNCSRRQRARDAGRFFLSADAKMGAGEVEEARSRDGRDGEGAQAAEILTMPGGGVLKVLQSGAHGGQARGAGVVAAEETKRTLTISTLYVNSISDHLFGQSRWVAKRIGEPAFLWDRAYGRGRRNTPRPHQNGRGQPCHPSE